MNATARRLGAACLLLALWASPAHAQSQRPPTLDDLLDLVQVSSAQISPDGHQVIFSRSEIKNWQDNKRVSTVWISDVDGNNQRQFLASDKDKHPHWSPDGRHVAFLSTRDQKEDDKDALPQIWLIRRDGGEAWKLTDHKGSIKSFKWGADSRQLFFLSEDAKTEAEKAAEKAGDDVVFVDEGPNGQTRGRYTSLWVIETTGTPERKITRDRLLLGAFDPAPDGRRVAVTVRPDNARNGQHKTELAIVDVASGTLRHVTSNEAPESDPRWSPDGRWLAFQAPSDNTWDLAQEKIWLLAMDGEAANARRLSDEYAGTIGDYLWMPDSRRLVFSGTQNGRGGAYELNVDSGKLRVIATGDWAAGLDSLSKDGRLAAGVPTTPTTSGDVYVMSTADGESRRVTTVNPQAASLQMSRFRWMKWKSRDGVEIEGLLWLPADYQGGRKLPLLVSVHGGPAGVWTSSFRAVNHLYTSLGWAVLEPNVRGSSSYGDALLRGNMKDIGGGDYQDLITGVDVLITQGIADPSRLAIRGWSYGGILGGWAITQTPRFKAASLGAMVADWASEYAMGFNHDIRLWYIGGTPWENPEGYRRQSPYTHIAKVSTPTILFHGEEDDVDTIGQSMIFYQGLKDRGIPVRFLRFPREGHGFREPHHVRIRDAEEIAWLMKHTLGVEWQAPVRPLERPDAAKATTP